MNNDILNKMISEAKEIANNNFCCNHSNYTVGVTILTKSGKIYKGFNIENDGIQSICAERVTISKALTDNEKDFICMVVVGKDIKHNNFIKTLPCGYCRQFLREYANKDFTIYTYDDNENKLYTYKLIDLLPESFSLQ